MVVKLGYRIIACDVYSHCMTKNPFINALVAGLYILLISTVMYQGTKYAPRGPSFLAPVAVISLFTLSAAVMGYFFCYTPAVLYFDGKKKQALDLFLKTTAIFSVFTAAALILLFTGIFR